MLEKKESRNESKTIETTDSSVSESERNYDLLEKRAIRKLDLLVIPLVTMFQLLSFLDRTNVGNARIAGLQTDLGMSNTQFSLALTVTFIPYCLVEIPSNLVLKKIGPQILLPLIVTLWGMVTVFQGLVSSYEGLIACRFFLGLCEGGLFPGIVLYLSMFYRRHQLQLRIAIVFSASSLAGAFSGLLASAIVGMDGIGGKRGWAWIFILEGLFTVVFGLISFFLMPSTPRTCRFLTDEEKDAAERMLQADWTVDNDGFSWREAISAFKAPQVLFLALCFFGNGVTLYGAAFFIPTVINSFGNSTPVQTQLLSVPPYAVSFVVTISTAYLSDKYKVRSPTAILSGILALAGYALFLGQSNVRVRYGALFLQSMGAFLTGPAISAWQVNNVMPHYKKAVAISFGVLLSNAGGILSTWIFTGPPNYTAATATGLGMSILIIAFSIANLVFLHWKNGRKQLELLNSSRTPGSTEDEAEKRRLGDRHPAFVYTL